MMKPTVERIAGRGLRCAAAGLTLAAAIPLAGATTASAATAPTADAVRPLSSPCSAVSCVYNYHSGSVPLTCVQGTGCPTGDTVYLSNGYQVYMECWFTGPSYTGNYTSSRWFGVEAVPLAGEWVVHSSYVYNQTSVGEC